jgi:hypothetical protein
VAARRSTKLVFRRPDAESTITEQDIRTVFAEAETGRHRGR